MGRLGESQRADFLGTKNGTTKADELKNTQFILIDKEYTPPQRDLKLRVSSRHMKPNDPSKPIDRDNPPLITYYSGNYFRYP